MDDVIGALIPILVPAIVFAFLAAIVLVPIALQFHHKRAVLETVKASLGRGEPLPPELVADLMQETRGLGKAPSPERDLRAGAVLIAVALAIAVFAGTIAAVEEDPDALIVAALAAFPGFIGIVKIAFGVIGLRRAPL